jgi:hypothetical protein
MKLLVCLKNAGEMLGTNNGRGHAQRELLNESQENKPYSDDLIILLTNKK